MSGPYVSCENSAAAVFCSTCGVEELERRDRVDDFLCSHTGSGVVWDIDVESGVHLTIHETRGRVFYHRDLKAKLSGRAHR